MAVPSAGWAQVTVNGSFNDGTVVDAINSAEYDDLAKAAEALNEIAGKGRDDDPETSVRNDLNINISINANQSISNESGGAAIVLDGSYTYTYEEIPGDPSSEVEGTKAFGFKNISIDGNGFSLDGGENGTGTMLGIANVAESISVSKLTFKNGLGGESGKVGIYGGAGLFIGSNAAGGSLAHFQEVNLNDVVFEGNRGESEAGSSASGGGLLVTNDIADPYSTDGKVAMEGVSFLNNYVQSSLPGLTPDTLAEGGGATIFAVGDISYLGGKVVGNTAVAYSGDFAVGGGLNVQAGRAFSADIEGVGFSGNTAKVSGQSTTDGRTTKALGGAFYGKVLETGASRFTVGSATFTGGDFTDNQAVAIGSKAEAYGGALALLGNLDATFENSDFVNNAADASLGTGAYGGAIYAQGSLSFVNSSFTDNSADGSTAYGGAIFMDVSVNTNTAVSQSVLDMAVEVGEKVVISGNTAGGKASGIYIGNTDGDSSVKNAAFNIDNAGRMEILDPLTVALDNGKSFTMNVEGEGSLLLAGKNVISAEGGTTLNFSQGATEVTRDFSLVVKNKDTSNFEMNLTKAGIKPNEFSFDSRRDSAMIDLTEAGNNKSFLVEANMAAIDITDTRRQLVDYQKDLIIVKGAGTEAGSLAAQLTAQKFDPNLADSKFVANSGGDVVLELDYNSPFTAALKRAGQNTVSGASALTALLQYDNIYEGLTDEQVLDIIHSNYGTLTPEYGAVAGVMGLNVTQFINRMAVRQGLRNQHNSSLPTPLSAQPSFGGPHEGARVWGGYAGNFRKVDDAGGYYGYDQDTSAALLGISYDLGPEATVGIFGGYSNNKADLNRIGSEVESDGTHIGLLARLTPGASIDPNLAVYLDASYSRYENDAYRRLGPEKARSDFDQTAYTAGVGAEYAVPINHEVLLTPSLDLRYTKLEQESYREKGLTANYIKGYDVNSFTSSLALTASREISIRGGTITPSARLGWNHEYGDTEVNTTARYLNPSGGLMPTAYKLGTVDQNRDSMDAGVGLKALLNSGSYHQVGLNVSYDVNISKDADTHSVYGGLEYSF